MSLKEYFCRNGFIILLTVFVLILVGGAAFTLLTYVSVSLEENGHPLINSTVVFNKSTTYGYIDTNGIGYQTSVYYNIDVRTSHEIIIGDIYNIRYFCDGNGFRKIHSAEDITIYPMPTETPNSFKCVNISGECK